MDKAIISTPLIFMELIADKTHLLAINFIDKPTSEQTNLPPVIQQAQNDINAYLKNPTHEFTTPYKLTGTSLQQKIWKLLTTIPAKETKTYGELASALHTSPRVVGNACRANPIPIIIPCHRVVAANGLGGYAGQKKGSMFNIKTTLLDHEQ